MFFLAFCYILISSHLCDDIANYFFLSCRLWYNSEWANEKLFGVSSSFSSSSPSQVLFSTAFFPVFSRFWIWKHFQAMPSMKNDVCRRDRVVSFFCALLCWCVRFFAWFFTIKNNSIWIVIKMKIKMKKERNYRKTKSNHQWRSLIIHKQPTTFFPLHKENNNVNDLLRI